MAAEGEREVAISDDGVLLEVYEVQDSAQQECMMLVQKLSESSLGANEREKSNLTEQLAEAEKEVANSKASLWTANSSVDDLTNRLQREKEEKLQVQTLLEGAITEGREKDEKLAALEKGGCEQEKCLSEVKKQLTALEAERQTLRKEMEGLRGQNEDADEQISILNTRLQKERQKLMVSMEESEEQMISLKDLLHEQRQKLEDLKTSSDAELVQLRAKLAHQQKVNESLSVEGDESIARLQRQVDETKQINQELSKAKTAALARVATLQEELTEMGCELDGLKEHCERISTEKEKSVEELKCQLRQKNSERETLAAAKEEAERKRKQAESERNHLECRFNDLEQQTDELLTCSYEEPRTSMKAPQEDGCVSAPCAKDSKEGDSTKESDDDKPEENDWEQLYCQLQMENSNLHKQYIKLKKHRNQILRENTNQKQQMQMAVAQLTNNNSKFHRQMEQLRMQLGMAELFCQEKAQEAHTLELQLQQILFQNQQFERNHWAPVPVQRYWQPPARYTDGRADSWRVDG